MPKTSAKFLEAQATLPDDLKPVFTSFVEDYEFLTLRHFGRGYIAYMVLADMVRAGWRHKEPPKSVSPKENSHG